MQLAFQLLTDDAILPSRAHDGDAGFDLHTVEPARIGPGERLAVRTGVAVELPSGHAGLVLPRSGLARRHGITLVNSPGLIDAGYRGEIQVLLANTDPAESFTAEVGDRVAQLVVVAVPDLVAELRPVLSGSERGERGFGSSGR